MAGLLAEPLPALLTQARRAHAKRERLALDAFVVGLFGLSMFKYIGFRHVRSSGPGATSDLLFDREGFLFRRWQVRCRNSAVLMIDDVAATLGMLGYCESDVGVVMCTGEVEFAAAEFAAAARKSIRQPIVVLDGDALASLAANPRALMGAVEGRAPEALTLAR